MSQIDLILHELENLYDQVENASHESQLKTFQDFLKTRLANKSSSEKKRILKVLRSRYVPLSTSSVPPITDQNINNLNAIVTTILGKQAIEIDNQDVGELLDRLHTSLDTVFASVNEILHAINAISPTPIQDKGNLTLREVIRDRLDQTIDPGELPLKIYLDKIKLAFQASIEAFKEAVQEKVMEILEEFSPERLIQETGSKGMRIGPMYKAALYDAYEEKFGRLFQFTEKGHLLQEIILLFERRFGNKMMQGEKNEKQEKRQ